MLFLSPVYTSVPYGLLWWILAPSQPNQYWQCPSNGSDVWFWWRFYLPWELELTGDFWWELNNTYAIEQFPSAWRRHDPHWKLTELLWTLSLIWQKEKNRRIIAFSQVHLVLSPFCYLELCQFCDDCMQDSASQREGGYSDVHQVFFWYVELIVLPVLLHSTCIAMKRQAVGKIRKIKI